MNSHASAHGTRNWQVLWLLSFLCSACSVAAAWFAFPFRAIAAQQASQAPAEAAKVHKQPLATTRLSLGDRKEIFTKVWKEIRDHYYDPSLNGVDWQEVRRRYSPLIEAAKNDQEFYALLSQMTSELRDAHTRFSSPEQWKNYRRQLGITVGFTVDDVDGKTVVTGVVPGSSAAHAGIEPGMVVLSVDGMPITQRISEVEKSRLPSSSERATRWFIYNRVFAGPRDTELSVRLQRANGSIFETSVTREVRSAAPEVVTHVLPSGNVYIRFDGFERPITREFREALLKFRNAPGMIIDLRRNGGGDLAVLLPIAGYFFPKKTLFAKDATRTGRPLSSYAGLFKLPLNLYVGKPGAQIYSGPVVVLVDAHSASSSELFAAGMQETRRARILGSQSCGCVLGIAKPRVMKGGGVLEMSEVLWFSPQGRKLEGTGIIPDQVVVPSVADLQRGRDAVVAEADKTLVKTAVLESQGPPPSSATDKKAQRE
jgi:carboxyl-terminal processing protease